jgi:hypothetical protein
MSGKQMLGLSALALALLLIAWAFVQLFPGRGQAAVATFEECVAAGNPIMESYPRRCMTPDGQMFDEAQLVARSETPRCVVAGCSNHLCIEESESEAGGGVSTCEYRAEYACYQNATCARKPNGHCGWTQTEELQQCLGNPPQESESALIDEDLQMI